MCAPNLTPLTAGLQVGDALSSGIGGAARAAALRASLRMEARAQRFNAQLLERDADYVLFEGQTNAARARDTGRRIAASQRAAFAANNVVVGYGAAAQTEASTNYVAAQTADDIELAARRAALGIRIDASNARLGAATASAQRRATMPVASGFTSFVSSLGPSLADRSGLGGWLLSRSSKRG